MEIIARPHVVFVRIITLRGKQGSKARVPAHWQNPIHLQTNSTNACSWPVHLPTPAEGVGKHSH